MASADAIYVPVRDSEEEVKVDLNNLPDHNDVLDLLKAEQAPLDLWLAFAREYFKQGKVSEFLEFLQEGSSPEVEEFYADVKYDRIAILNALGAYYTSLGRTSKRQKDEYFIKAVDFYNKAARIDRRELTTWVGKGQLQVAKGELDQALEMFRIVLAEHKDHVPALLGEACAQFNKGKYKEALELYKAVLRRHPRCPAAVRVGIALCHYRMQFSDKARREFHAAKSRQAFERVLQLDENNVEALVALGMLDINSDDGDGVKRGLEKMRAAFGAYPFCSMALNQMGIHAFFAGQHDAVQQLMEASLAATDHSLMRAESLHTLARSFHARGNYEKATAYYRAAAQEVNNPGDFILPFFGLGQIQLKLGDLKSALASFEKVLSAFPNDSQTLKVVGNIHAQQGRLELALKNFKKVTDLDPSDIDGWVEQGELLVATDLSAALEAFQRAHKLLKKKEARVPLELLNNMAVLHHEKGNTEEALATFRQALGEGPWEKIVEGPQALPPEAAGTAGASESNGHHAAAAAAATGSGTGAGAGVLEGEREGGGALPLEKVTVVFNLARLHEKAHDTARAQALYGLILRHYPEYVDCHLRLAAIANARNDVATSTALVEKALEVSADNVDALAMRSVLETQQDNMPRAKETLKRILELTRNKNTPALLALGNWNLRMSTRPSKDPKAEAVYLEKARECFQKALSQNGSNMYAANGVGCILGEKGLFDMAKDIFSQVQEAAAGSMAVEMPDVWINLAHVHLAKPDFPLAVKLYQNCLRKFYQGRDARVLQLLARAHYEAEQWPECRRTLQRAVLAAPANYTLRFDLAVTLQKLAMVTLKPEHKTSQQVRKAVSEIKNALRLFGQLAALGPQHAHGFDGKKIELHTKYCTHLMETAKTHLEIAERQEQQQKLKAETLRQQALAAEALQKAQEQRRLQEEKLRKEEMERRAAEVEEEFRRRKEMWNKHHKAAADVDMDDDAAPAGEDGGGGSARKGKKERKRKKKSKRAREEEEEEEPEYRENEDDDNEEKEEEARMKRQQQQGEEEDDEEQQQRRRRLREEGEGEGEQAGTPVGTPLADADAEDGEVGAGEEAGAAASLAAAGLLDDDVEENAEQEDEAGRASKRRRRGRAVAESDDEDNAPNEDDDNGGGAGATPDDDGIAEDGSAQAGGGLQKAAAGDLVEEGEGETSA